LSGVVEPHTDQADAPAAARKEAVAPLDPHRATRSRRSEGAGMAEAEKLCLRLQRAGAGADDLTQGS
jgi:hypothetical protein